MTTMRLPAILFSLLMITGSAWSDVLITENGRVDRVNVQTIKGGRVYFLDRSGALKNVVAGEVRHIHFDDLPELQDAARYESRGELEDALDKLLLAMSRARTADQRLWCHARLAEVHGQLGDVIEAAGHFGAVVEQDASDVWLELAPEGDLNDATFYSAGEAVWYLTRALRGTSGTMEQTIRSLLAQIEPVFDVIAEDDLREYRGGSTISGILLRDIGKPRPGRSQEAPQPNRPVETDSPRSQRPTGDSADVIDEMLGQGLFHEAVALCDRLASDPGERDLARFLHQYGRSLQGVGRPRDAALHFARSAIEFPGSRYAPLSWIELAGLYQSAFDSPRKARELLEVAATLAAELGELDTANLARQRLQELED